MKINMISRLNLLLIAMLLLFMSGCKVGPNYKPPSPDMPAGYGEKSDRTSAAEPNELAKWWKNFNDPNLDALIVDAINGNLTLKQAESRLRQARYEKIITASGLWPTVNSSGSYQRTHGGGGVSSSVGAATTGGTFDLYQAGLDASWELDVFGGTRRAVEAANANIGAALENQRDVLVSLMAEVAINYIELRGFQRQIVIAQENLKSQRETVELTQKQLDVGTVTELEVSQAKAQMAATAAQIPSLESSSHQTMHLLSVLLGKDPMALSKLLTKPAPIPAAPPEVPAGLPSDLLRQRADIRRAERQLAAATANIGVATADLFPKFSLTGSAGRQATSFENLGKSGSSFWSVGPGFSWPIFTAGSIRANINVQNEIQKQTAAAYEQTVLTALQETEDALVAYSQEYKRRKDLLDSVNASRQSLDLANQQYLLGTTAFLNVLIAQRGLYLSEASLVQSDTVISTNVVSLYKALGGGWQYQE